jgi:hypothetical protein
MGDGWFVKMIWAVGGWCIVCIGKVLERKVVVVCEKKIGDVNYEVKCNIIK